jgi:hypothetical protein
MVAASKFSMNKIELCERTNSRQAILLIDAYTPAHAVPQKRAVFYFLFYFRLFSGRPSMPHEKREKRSIYL